MLSEGPATGSLELWRLGRSAIFLRSKRRRAARKPRRILAGEGKSRRGIKQTRSVYWRRGGGFEPPCASHRITMPLAPLSHLSSQSWHPNYPIAPTDTRSLLPLPKRRLAILFHSTKSLPNGPGIVWRHIASFLTSLGTYQTLWVPAGKKAMSPGRRRRSLPFLVSDKDFPGYDAHGLVNGVMPVETSSSTRPSGNPRRTIGARRKSFRPCLRAALDDPVCGNWGVPANRHPRAALLRLLVATLISPFPTLRRRVVVVIFPEIIT